MRRAPLQRNAFRQTRRAARSRVVISKKYQGKDLYLAFPAAGRWYLVAHDKLVVIAAETTRWLRSSSWTSNGEYSVARPSKQMLDRLSEHALTP